MGKWKGETSRSFSPAQILAQGEHPVSQVVTVSDASEHMVNIAGFLFGVGVEFRHFIEARRQNLDHLIQEVTQDKEEPGQHMDLYSDRVGRGEPLVVIVMETSDAYSLPGERKGKESEEGEGRDNP